MKRALVILGCLGTALGAPESPPFGFSAERATALRPLELRLHDTISPDACRREHRILTEEPHLTGSPRNYELAQYMAEQWKPYGLDATW